MSAESFERDGQPLRSHARILQRVCGAAISLHDFAHQAIRIRLQRARIARVNYETQVAEALLNAAQSAIAATIEVDLASARRDASVREVRLESDHRPAPRS